MKRRRRRKWWWMGEIKKETEVDAFLSSFPFFPVCLCLQPSNFLPSLPSLLLPIFSLALLALLITNIIYLATSIPLIFFHHILLTSLFFFCSYPPFPSSRFLSLLCHVTFPYSFFIPLCNCFLFNTLIPPSVTVSPSPTHPSSSFSLHSLAPFCFNALFHSITHFPFTSSASFLLLLIPKRYPILLS